VHHPEVVERDVREVRASGALAHRPHVRSRRREPVVDLDIATLGQLHARQIEPDASGVRRTADGDEEIGPLDHALAVRPLHRDANSAARVTFDLSHMRLKQNLDAFVVEQIEDRLANVRILFARQLRTWLQYGHLRPETPHPL
jgi:hypothetical protein